MMTVPRVPKANMTEDTNASHRIDITFSKAEVKKPEIIIIVVYRISIYEIPNEKLVAVFVRPGNRV